MSDQRNTILAIVLSLIIIVGWELFFGGLMPKPAPQTTAEQAATPPGPPSAQTLTPPAVTPSPGGAITPERQEAVAEERRVRIKTPHLHGSVSLTGLRFDDITLAAYRETPDPSSPEVTLLSPPSAPKPYYIEMGWLASDDSVKVPSNATVWTVEDAGAVLTDTQPLVARWDNDAGLRFTRTIRADDKFLFTVEQTVENTGERPVTLFPYSLVARYDKPATSGFLVLHEGPVGVLNDTLEDGDVDYDDIQKKGRITIDSVGGWIGITDHFWLAAIAHDQQRKVTASFNLTQAGGRDRYQTDLRGEAVTIAPGESRALKEYVFAGAKEAPLLASYAENPGIRRFDMAVDWGWFWFLTKPFFYALLWLKSQLGTFGLAILAFTVGLRLLMFPIANKQFAAMNKMKALQPQMKVLQERYAKDKQKLQTEMMELYKREKANPLAGCLPIVIQIPIFFALYKVLYVTIEMRHAPFYGWIKDLSAADPTNVFNLFGLIPWDPAAYLSFLHLGAWPVMMGISYFVQQKLSPQPPDPVQARIMLMLPIVFTFMLASMPVGLVIYWTWSTLLGIIQQWALMKTHPEPVKAKT